MRARRCRGRLFIALHGPDDAIRGVTVCTDFAMACLALAGALEGDVIAIPPDEGAPLRKYLAGGPPPLPCAMRAFPDNIVAEVARTAGVSKWTAIRAVEAVMEDRGGVGLALYCAKRGESTCNDLAHDRRSAVAKCNGIGRTGRCGPQL